MDLHQPPAHAAALEVAHRHTLAWLDGLRERRVHPGSGVDAVAGFAGPLPEHGEDPATVVEALVAATEPGLVASPGPRYFGYVIGGGLPSTVAADQLAVAWDQVAGLEVMSPAAAAAEEVAGAWARELLGVAPEASFGFTTGAQMANFTGLAAGRHAVLARAGWDVERDGLQGAPRVHVVAGAQSHSTIPQALRFLGFGGTPDRAEADGQGRLVPSSLREVLARSEGPAIVCAQAGNVDTGAFDPVAEIAEVCRERGAWLHVDGAFGLWAAASPRLRHLTAGVELADSLATDCHKWLNVPYDSALVFTRDPEAHMAAMTWQAAYVQVGESRDPFRFVPEASRRARGFAVWAAIRELGREGVAAMVERSCDLAGRFADALRDEPGVEVLNEVVLNQVLVRFGDSDEHTAAVMQGIRDSGEAWVSGTVWDGRPAMRFSVSNWMTTEADIDRTLAAVLAAHRRVAA